jgi:hypothetical protein
MFNISKTGNVHVTLWRVRVKPFAMEAEKCLPFVLLRYIFRCQQCNKYGKLCHGSTARGCLYCWRYISLCQEYKQHLRLHVKCLIFLSDFNQTSSFATEFRKSPQQQITRKSVQWEPRWHMRTNGQTDSRTNMAKLISALRHCAIAPKENYFAAQH